MAQLQKPQSLVITVLLCMEALLFPVTFFVLHVIFIASTKGFLEDVRDTPEVLHPPYNPYIWASAVTPIVVSSIGLTSTVVLFYPQFVYGAKSKYWWAAITTFRLCIVVILTVIAVATAQYMPLPLGSCENQHEWRHGSNVPPNTPTVFDVLPRGWSYSSKSHRYHYHDGCTRIVQIWRLDLAVAALYFVTAGVSAYMWARMQGRWWGSNSKSAAEVDA